MEIVGLNDNVGSNKAGGGRAANDKKFFFEVDNQNKGAAFHELTDPAVQPDGDSCVSSLNAGSFKEGSKSEKNVEGDALWDIFSEKMFLSCRIISGSTTRNSGIPTVVRCHR